MNSRTIFSAYIDARLKFKNTRRPDRERVRALHQADKFEAETSRRLDERDTMHATIDRLQRELAEARAEVARRTSDIDAARNTITELDTDLKGANAFLDEVAFVLQMPPAYMGGVNGWAEVKMGELAEARAYISTIIDAPGVA